MGASAPPNFDTWGLSPPKVSDGCPKHTESGTGRDLYTATLSQACLIHASKKHGSECTKADHPKSKTYFFWGSIPLGPLHRTALAHTAMQ